MKTQKFLLASLVAVLVASLFTFGVQAAPDVYDVTLDPSSTTEHILFEVSSNRSSLWVQVSGIDGVVHDSHLTVVQSGTRWYAWLELAQIYGDEELSVRVPDNPSQVSHSDWRDPDGDGWYRWLPLIIDLIEPSVVRPGGVITITGNFNETNPAGMFVALAYGSAVPRPEATITSWTPQQIVATIPTEISPLVAHGWRVFVGHLVGFYIYPVYASSNSYSIEFSGPNAVTVGSFSARACWFRLLCK